MKNERIKIIIIFCRSPGVGQNYDTLTHTKIYAKEMDWKGVKECQSTKSLHEYAIQSFVFDSDIVNEWRKISIISAFVHTQNIIALQHMWCYWNFCGMAYSNPDVAVRNDIFPFHIFGRRKKKYDWFVFTF